MVRFQHPHMRCGLCARAELARPRDRWAALAATALTGGSFRPSRATFNCCDQPGGGGLRKAMRARESLDEGAGAGTSEVGERRFKLIKMVFQRTRRLEKSSVELQQVTEVQRPQLRSAVGI